MPIGAWQRKCVLDSYNILIGEIPVSFCTTNLHYVIGVACLWNCKETWMTRKKVECYLAYGMAVDMENFSVQTDRTDLCQSRVQCNSVTSLVQGHDKQDDRTPGYAQFCTSLGQV